MAKGTRKRKRIKLTIFKDPEAEPLDSGRS
jgi:hypothetical protein